MTHTLAVTFTKTQPDSTVFGLSSWGRAKQWSTQSVLMWQPPVQSSWVLELECTHVLDVSSPRTKWSSCSLIWSWIMISNQKIIVLSRWIGISRRLTIQILLLSFYCESARISCILTTSLHQRRSSPPAVYYLATCMKLSIDIWATVVRYLSQTLKKNWCGFDATASSIPLPHERVLFSTFDTATSFFTQYYSSSCVAWITVCIWHTWSIQWMYHTVS